MLYGTLRTYRNNKHVKRGLRSVTLHHCNTLLLQHYKTLHQSLAPPIFWGLSHCYGGWAPRCHPAMGFRSQDLRIRESAQMLGGYMPWLDSSYQTRHSGSAHYEQQQGSTLCMFFRCGLKMGRTDEQTDERTDGQTNVTDRRTGKQVGYRIHSKEYSSLNWKKVQCILYRKTI